MDSIVRNDPCPDRRAHRVVEHGEDIEVERRTSLPGEEAAVGYQWSRGTVYILLRV